MKVFLNRRGIEEAGGREREGERSEEGERREKEGEEKKHTHAHTQTCGSSFFVGFPSSAKGLYSS